MGRELKRKQAKREGKNVREVQKKNEDKPLSPKTFVIIMIVLFVFFVVLYILTGLFVTKELKWFNKDNENETTVVENKILAVDTLKQMEEIYYVYYYDTKEENSEVSNIVNILQDKVYRVDLNDGFNTNYVGEPSGVVSDITQLKVSNPTVVKVSSEQIVEFYSGVEQITSSLN